MAADRRTDSELVIAARSGSQEAFGELVARYRDAVFGVAFHRLGDFEEAGDAAQEAFVKAYLNLPKLREPSTFGHWLYRIADGTAVDMARRPRREVSFGEMTETSATVGASAARGAQAELASAIRKALGRLPEATRLAVILHYVNGYSHAEVADFLGSTPGAVKTRLSRARSQLREEMIEQVEGGLKRARKTFRFVAHSADGALVTGTTESPSAAAVRRHLAERGFRVDCIRPLTAKEQQEEMGDPSERIVRVIFEQAIRNRATAITCKREETGPRVLVSYSIDGVWHEVMSIPEYVWQPLRDRLAQMAKVELVESASRRSGRIRFDFERGSYDLRATFTRAKIGIAVRAVR
jgi:RNA polymerase sigma-70 factor (ECF subfamily)